MNHTLHLGSRCRWTLIALAALIVLSSLPLSACSSDKPISTETMREAAVEQLLKNGELFNEVYSNFTAVGSVEARGRNEYVVSVKTSDIGVQDVQVTIVKEELFLAYEDRQFAEYIYKWYRGIGARQFAEYIQSGVIKAVGGLKFRLANSPFSTELWTIAVFQLIEGSEQPDWYFYSARSAWSSLLDAFELAYSQEKDEAFRKFADRSSDSSSSTTGSSNAISDDHGDTVEQATALPLARNISGILADQKDADVFAWLASEPGAYRVRVISLDGNKIEAILSFQEVATGRLKEVKKATSSKTIDVTVVAAHPAMYFVQLKHADKAKVAEYSVKADPTEDPSLPPKVAVMPQNGIPGDTINIFGSGFGSEAGSIQFGKSSIAPIVMWSPNQIIAQVPAGSGSVDVAVKTKEGETSETFRFTYGPKLGDDVIQQTRDWAKARIPEAEKRLEEAEDRMWEAYVKAEEAYDELKQTKGTEVFQDIDKAIEAVAQDISTDVAESLTDLLIEEAQKRGETGAALVAPVIAKYAFIALRYYNIGKWTAMDAVLVSRNIKSNWYRWAVLRPAVKEYERAQEELDTLRIVAEMKITAKPVAPLLVKDIDGVKTYAISDDAQFVVFITNDDQLFFLDRKTGEKRHVAESFRMKSYSTVGISGDGSMIVFQTDDGIIRVEDTREGKQLWAFDKPSSLYLGDISATGNALTVMNESSTRPASGAVGGTDQVFVYDLKDGTEMLVSRSSSGSYGRDQSWVGPRSISRNGRLIVFMSYASNLMVNNSGQGQIFVFDRDIEKMTIASTYSGGRPSPGDDPAELGVISGNGRFVAFTTIQKLTSDDLDTDRDIFVNDLESQTTELVSRDERNFRASDPDISNDGRFVVFTGDSTVVILFDRVTRKTVLLSIGLLGSTSNSRSYSPKITADGTYILFISEASNLVEVGKSKQNLYIVENPFLSAD